MAGRGYSIVGLHQPKNSLNIGSALRAAGVYGAAAVYTAGCRYRCAPTDTMKAHRRVPLVVVDDLYGVVPYDCVPVAIEIVEGAKPMPEYRHPERAFYVFGPEDGSIPAAVLQWCRDIVYVPTDGCMNLAATVNVVLYDRMAKQAGVSNGRS